MGAVEREDNALVLSSIKELPSMVFVEDKAPVSKSERNSHTSPTVSPLLSSAAQWSAVLRTVGRLDLRAFPLYPPLFLLFSAYTVFGRSPPFFLLTKHLSLSRTQKERVQPVVFACSLLNPRHFCQSAFFRCDVWAEGDRKETETGSGATE
jgi:hypothetical protein